MDQSKAIALGTAAGSVIFKEQRVAIGLRRSRVWPARKNLNFSRALESKEAESPVLPPLSLPRNPLKRADDGVYGKNSGSIAASTPVVWKQCVDSGMVALR
jgi:hypothetical protein